MNNQLNRKRCLSRARGGDYIHPGEEEAIDMVMSKFSKDSNRKILDVGCGLGGTAAYIKKNGYGTPVCIDKEADCIEYVNENYPDLETYACDVLNLTSIFQPQQFDLAYLFNSFYAFPGVSPNFRTHRFVIM
jgi:SAM-dependent methyltransferase